MKLGRSDTIAICGFLIVIGMLAMWCIDISVSALLSGGVLFNGTFFSDPMLMYHVALYLLVFVIFLFFLITVHSVVKDDDKK